MISPVYLMSSIMQFFGDWLGIMALLAILHLIKYLVLIQQNCIYYFAIIAVGLMSFVDKLKSVFRSKPPSYKTYTHAQLKIIAMKARIYLQQYYKKCVQLIQAQDSILVLRKQVPEDCYKILQEIGRHVVEVESIKIYCEILRKIQDKPAGIIKTNGDIALLKTQLNWFQSLLWYRKCKKIVGLEDLHAFCFNFFKGVDVTSEITPKCEIFKLFPLILYLDPHCIVPLKKLYPEITQYIKTNLDFSVLEKIFKINRQQIKRWVNQDQMQYQQRYLSKSKSPIKIKKSTTPKKINTSTYQLSNENIRNINRNDQDSVNNEKSANSENRQLSNLSKTQKDQNGQNHKNSSFMRRLMQNSKMKEKKLHKILCKGCGREFQSPIIDFNPQVSFGQDSNFAQPICQECQKNNIKNLQQIETSFEIPKNSNSIKKTCQICGIVKNQNQISFNNNLEQLKELTQNINQNICSQCFHLKNTKKQQTAQQNQHLNLLQENNGIKAQFYDKNQKNKEADDQKNRVILNVEQIQKQIKPPNPDGNQKYQDNPQININKNIQDEEDSLKFIRESIVQKKKPMKKPYMVSIYCRAQFTDKSKRQS